MIHFCTYCDHRYLPRALAMVESLERHAGPFTLWLLALNTECERLLGRLAHPRIRVVPLANLESADQGLVAAKRDRTLVEYYFTLSPCWPLHLLQTQPEIQTLTYLDSDLYFFSSPQPIFDELGNASVGIIPHRFPAEREDAELCHGRYNVGWITWRRDPDGLACLADWRSRCLAWCQDRCEDGKYADQGYLDAWTSLFRNVHVVRHPGANVAPWNIARHAVDRIAGGLFSDGEPLIFYHFHGVSRHDDDYANTNLEHVLSTWWRRRQLAVFLYEPYMRAVARARDQLRAFGEIDDRFRSRRFTTPGLDTDCGRWSLARRFKTYLRVASGRLVRQQFSAG